VIIWYVLEVRTVFVMSYIDHYFQRDEDFDSSYENLLSLANALGEVKPRSVPEHVIASLPTGRHRDWSTSDSDQRCPICLDDVRPS
jgi:hypothetical protein